jgi:hypothetical protein
MLAMSNRHRLTASSVGFGVTGMGISYCVLHYASPCPHPAAVLSGVPAARLGLSTWTQASTPGRERHGEIAAV